MKVKKWFFIPLFLSIASFLTFALVPSTLDGDGVLQEPFYLILFGYFFLFTSILMLTFTFFKQK
jgi:hypothetical protein